MRFGDPECQCILMRMKSDLLDLMMQTCEGELDQTEVQWLDAWSMTVVLASQGYPGSYQKGTVISGVEKIRDSKVFHAGTALNEDNQLINTGGRVLGITSIGKTIQEAQRKAYDVFRIHLHFDGMRFRELMASIGQKASTEEILDGEL